MKGVYHINAVDIVTQWELVASVEHISEAYLLPEPLPMAYEAETAPCFQRHMRPK
jgi:hypothetical protein